MKKTLLLVYIHGFQGGDNTFGDLPANLQALVSYALPAVRVVTEIYPKYETRGDLRECVSRFREWLQNKVIDLEVENQTPSPTVDPAVHVFLLGHSMGGIVGSETIILLATEQPIQPSSSATSSDRPSGTTEGRRLVEPGSFMFPHIQGLLAFDTPFLGIAPGAVSYSAEGQYKTVVNTLSDVAGVFGFRRGSNTDSHNTAQATQSNKRETVSLTDFAAPSTDVAATPSWQRWGRYAMFAGAIGAAAAGGAAAIYQQRQNITGGWNWISSHLEFVGCLGRPKEQLQRLELLTKIRRERGISCTNFYTCLGEGAQALMEKTRTGETSFSEGIIRSKNRTFCSLPQDIDDTADGRVKPSSKHRGLSWVKAVNNKAPDEIKAHITMFQLKQNPGFHAIIHGACDVIANSVDRSWYLAATEPMEGLHNEGAHFQRDVDSEFMDDVVVVN